jgi:UDP-3-O-[3-hydroxymyristoyl] glucosamine N-acyltransferase
MPDTPAHTLGEIAALIGGDLVGDGALPIADLAHPLEATRADQLVILFDAAMVARLGESPVRAAVIASDATPPVGSVDGYVRVGRPRYAMAALFELFAKRPHAPPGVHPSAVVEPGAVLGEGVAIGALSYVGPGATVGDGAVLMPHVTIGAGARVGAGSVLHSGVRIGEGVVLGERVLVHHNAALGADGFSFVTPALASFETARRGGGDRVETASEGIRRIASLGTVEIGDDVEIGACTAIDRANLGATRIGAGTKIDNHVQIGHNVRVGRDCLISGMVGLSGSVRVGDRVVLAGGVGVADHLTIGDDAIVGAGSGLWKDVAPKQIVAGYPAVPRGELLQREINIGRLPRVIRDVAELKRRVARLVAGLERE